MYTSSNNVMLNALMRWPFLASAMVALGGIFSGSFLGAALAWVVSVGLAAYGATRVFNKQLCDCEGHARRAGLGARPSLNWIVEYNPESGAQRPWELYSIVGDDENTKQHYASYSTQEHALARKAIMEEMINGSGE
jgi:hypothetical protein